MAKRERDCYDAAAETYLARSSFASTGNREEAVAVLATHFRSLCPPPVPATHLEAAVAAAARINDAYGIHHPQSEVLEWADIIARHMPPDTEPKRYRLICPDCKNPWDANHLHLVQELRVENQQLREQDTAYRAAVESTLEWIRHTAPEIMTLMQGQGSPDEYEQLFTQIWERAGNALTALDAARGAK